MANAKHGIEGVSDPHFKPDTSKHHVYDKKKGVYRLVKKAKKNAKPVLAQ